MYRLMLFLSLLLIGGCSENEQSALPNCPSGWNPNEIEVTKGDDLTLSYEVECKYCKLGQPNTCDHNRMAKRVCEEAGYEYGTYSNEKIEPLYPDGGPLGELHRQIMSGTAICRPVKD